MHIAEGILPPHALVIGYGVAAAGTGYGLRRMDYDRIPRVAALSSAFFVASFIHVPIGPTSAHLILSGLAGIILGWAAFPAIATALFLQGVFFGYGGITALGVNVTTMAVPAVVCYYLFHRLVANGRDGVAATAAFMAGSGAIVLACGLCAAFLRTAGKSLLPLILANFAAHAPVMIIEGLLTTATALFLRKVRPEMLSAPLKGFILKDSS